MEYKLEIKYYLIGYIIGLYSKKETVEKIEAFILEECWLDEFIELSDNSFYNQGSIVEILKADGNLTLLQSDVEVIEKVIFNELKIRIEKSPKSWKNEYKFLINYIRFKIDFFEMVFAERPIDYLNFTNDYELRNEGFNGCLVMPKEFIQFLESNSN